jgi:hypothetical protein
MKKNNKMVKFTAILATALMAVSATGISTSAQGVKEIEASKAAQSLRKLSKADGTTNVIGLEGTSAKPGDEISIPLTAYTGNTCEYFDIVLYFDSRLEFETVQGKGGMAPAFDSGVDENGTSFVTVVGFVANAVNDGEIATLKFKVPENAVNDNYFISFAEVNNFGSEKGDYNDYAVKDAVITVTGGTDRVIEGNALELQSVSGIAGENAIVKVVPYSDNKCECYDMLIEYDPALILTEDSVKGADSVSVYEENGRRFVAIVGYTTEAYKDGKAMATLNFELPENAKAGEQFNVRVAQLSNFATATTEIPVDPKNIFSAVITTAASADSNMYKTYNKVENGEVVETKVGLRGDINLDGVVNVRDASSTARYVATGDASKLTEEGLYYADVDENETVNIRDAAKIARFVVKGTW